MEIIDFLNKKLEKITSNVFIALSIITIVGILLRVYVTPFGMPPIASDTMLYMADAINYSRGDFSHFSLRFGWPIFLSIFFNFFQFDNYLDYVTVMQIISISISAFTSIVVYLIAHKIIEKKFALLASAFFIFDVNIIENSTYAITEPLFILLGLLSIYFALRNSSKSLLIGFAFAGLAMDIRLNGVILLIILITNLFLKRKSMQNVLKNTICGIGIFIIAVLPILISMTMIQSFVTGSVEQIYIQKENPQLLDLSRTIFGSQSQTLFNFHNINNEQSFSQPNIFLNAFIKENIHILKISIPFFALFVPIGMIIAFKENIMNKNIIFLTIIITLIISYPIYFSSAVDRNLFFILPFFSIFSAICIQKISLEVNIQNLFIVLFVSGLILISYGYLRETMNYDIELIIEKENIGKYIINNLEGNIFGDNYNFILHNIINVNEYPVNYKTNYKITLKETDYSIKNSEILKEYISKSNVNYLIVDNEDDNRYPIFNDIFINETKYLYLDKVFDSQEHKYKKYFVKIFKINHEILNK